jgi:hypothetical protein
MPASSSPSHSARTDSTAGFWLIISTS